MLSPLSNQQSAALILVQVELLDGRGFSPLAIGRLDIAEQLTAAADEDDAPASGRLFGIGAPGHVSTILAGGTALQTSLQTNYTERRGTGWDGHRPEGHFRPKNMDHIALDKTRRDGRSRISRPLP